MAPRPEEREALDLRNEEAGLPVRLIQIKPIKQNGAFGAGQAAPRVKLPIAALQQCSRNQRFDTGTGIVRHVCSILEAGKFIGMPGRKCLASSARISVRVERGVLEAGIRSCGIVLQHHFAAARIIVIDRDIHVVVRDVLGKAVI